MKLSPIVRLKTAVYVFLAGRAVGDTLIAALIGVAVGYVLAGILFGGG